MIIVVGNEEVCELFKLRHNVYIYAFICMTKQK